MKTVEVSMILEMGSGEYMNAEVPETDLTEEEKEIIRSGREEYKSGNFILLENL